MRALILFLAAAAAFGQTVKVAPWYSAGLGTQSLTTVASTDTSIDWIVEGQTDRMLMPRTGPVPKAGFYIGDRSNISAVYIGNCRWSSGSAGNNSTWTVVGWAGPFTGPFVANAVNYFTVNLSVNKYDVMCGRIELSTPHATNLAALSSILMPATSCCAAGDGTIAENCYYTLNEAKPSSLATGSMTQIPNNGCPVIEAWMTPPILNCIGDSIIQKNDGMADGGTQLVWPITNTSNGQTGQGICEYVSANYSNLIYQAMGWGGQTTVNIYNRFTSDGTALRPTFQLIDGGVNDVFLNCSTSTGCTGGQITTIETAIQNELVAAQAAHIQAYIMLIGPWTGNGSDATLPQMASIDTINANTISIAPTYGAIVIDQRCAIGQFETGGPAGNCYQFQSAYMLADGLGVHPNPAGMQVIANLVSLAFSTVKYNGAVKVNGGASQR